GSDGANCGACGTACAMGLTCCSGHCADTSNDPGHCGACGQACMIPNAMPGCAMGKCTAGSCNPGFADCNANPADGCEVSTDSDSGNCGRCGRSCAAPNATTGCVAGACVIAACMPGYRNCNGDPVDGCETDVANDVKNCGACGSNCMALPHA